MSDSATKTDNFLRAIERYAEAQRSQIESEAENFRKQEMNKAEEEGLREAYVLIQREMTEIRTGIAADLSRAETASRKKIFIRRKEIEDSVFEKVSNMLLDYTKTKDYITSMVRSADKAAKLLDSEDIIVFVKKGDDKLAEALKKSFGSLCDIRTGNDIMLGGFLAQSRSKGILIDETLDSRLDAQREWFCENSGLKVTE